jgi:phytoene dehydrogenase-like protein
MKSKYDAILVGGGHNGLVAAFYLAKAGLDVLVLERRQTVGGPASTIEFFPGYRGAITNSPGSLEPRIVADMRLAEFGLEWVKPDPSVIMRFPDGRFFVGWRDQQRLRDDIARNFSRRDAEAYFDIFAFFDDFARRIQVSLFQPPPTLTELVARLKTPKDEADFATIFFGSIREFLEQRLESDALRTSVAMMSTGGAAVAPSTPGTPMALLQRPMSLFSSTIEAVHDPRRQVLRGSTGLPRGGMGSITAAMRKALEAEGVTINTGAEVSSIRVAASGEVRGVALANGDTFDAGIVLSNLHPATTLVR